MNPFDTPEMKVPRDRFDRPLVIPPDGGKPVAYTRCTTFVDVLEDKYRLQRWQMRQVAVGLSERADLLLSVSAHCDDKRALDQIVDQALEAAKSSASATTGTAVHALCERVDRGRPLGTVPATAARDVNAYRAATASMRHLYIEQFSVHDELKVGGTPDRVTLFRDDCYIADIKTGQDITWGALKIAMQLAVYAHSVPYYAATGERAPDARVDVSQTRGIVIHLPAGEGHATLHWVDIEAGWDAVQCAREVRGWRSRKDWYEPIAPDPTPPAAALSTVDNQIATASTVGELRQVWVNAIAAGTWDTDRHVAQAKTRRAQLEKVAS